MTPNVPPSDLQDAHWEIPTHETNVLGPRRFEYALVIPVLNEGERVREQLLRIRRTEPEVDIVIADGGSTDGALPAPFLHETGVRAMLVKTGPGALSAQLRMAYAWCMREGYQGVVTMDGNGKDGVEGIRAFVTCLNQGFDYVQGSRYAPGGAALNTPLERTIGNRLIHAPLLSLAAGQRFTDTTNGFRAYSRRLLIDPRMGLFRDIFSRYNLLFHVTAQAPRLGFRCKEIGVIRKYPDDGAIPTKITRFSAKIELLKEAVRAAVGHFLPDRL